MASSVSRGALIGAALVSLAGCFDAIPADTLTAEGTGAVGGEVSDACTGDPLDGVKVVVGARATTTDARGRFLLAGLAPGAVQLDVSLPGYLTIRPEAVVTAGQTGKVDVTLSPVPKRLDPIPLDVLFVVDNSGSMGEEQAALALMFPEFLSVLVDAFDDIHIGVISSDLGAGGYTSLPSCESKDGDRGQLQSRAKVPGCTAPMGAFIKVQDGKATNVNGGDARAAFSCIVKLGTGGCGFEQPLESTRRALGQLSPNKGSGFLRSEAMLAVVVVSDEDDCSAVDPDRLFDPTQAALSDPLGPLTSFRCFEFGVQCDVNDRNAAGPREDCVPSGEWLHSIEGYAEFFRALKKSPDRLFFAAVAGPTTPVEVGRDGNNPVVRASCQSQNGVAIPAIRIKALVDALNPSLSPKPFFSICESSIPMKSIALQLVTANSFRSCP